MIIIFCLDFAHKNSNSFKILVIPHITDAIQEWVERVARIPIDINENGEPDVCIIEVAYLNGLLARVYSLVCD